MSTLLEAPLSQHPSRRVALLHNGDHMSREEFHRRYEFSPELHGVELIEGVVVMPSPIRTNVHCVPQATLVTWLGTYSAATPPVFAGGNGSVLLDGSNELQPDAVLCLPASHGGRSRINDDDYIEGPPELVIEISASSLGYDLNEKKRAYQRNGVREYLVWCTEDARLHWWELSNGEFKPIASDGGGSLHSGVFPGLWLDPHALLAGDLPGVLAHLQQGIASPEHLAFASYLQQSAHANG